MLHIISRDSEVDILRRWYTSSLWALHWIQLWQHRPRPHSNTTTYHDALVTSYEISISRAVKTVP